MNAQPSGSRAGADGQLVLDFPKPDPALEPLIETPANAAAILTLSRWRYWPDGQMALLGDTASGRSRILRWWAGKTGAAMISGRDLARADIEYVSSLSVNAFAVDDADESDRGEPLLAAMNLCRDRGVALLISGVSDPSGWNMMPLDLQSRLTAFPVSRLGVADDETLKLRLISACKARFMLLPEETAHYLVERMVRSYQMVDIIALELEQAAGGKALTKATARRALQEIEARSTND